MQVHGGEEDDMGSLPPPQARQGGLKVVDQGFFPLPWHSLLG